mmetsp:Transcript_6575/g.13305  ORF Transcript_6575/g.13305 Transcript_6575/m.13305 type:complete len:255 (-) Transcript_6575:1523-2287(-)
MTFEEFANVLNDTRSINGLGLEVLHDLEELVVHLRLILKLLLNLVKVRQSILDSKLFLPGSGGGAGRCLAHVHATGGLRATHHIWVADTQRVWHTGHFHCACTVAVALHQLLQVRRNVGREVWRHLTDSNIAEAAHETSSIGGIMLLLLVSALTHSACITLVTSIASTSGVDFLLQIVNGFRLFAFLASTGPGVGIVTCTAAKVTLGFCISRSLGASSASFASSSSQSGTHSPAGVLTRTAVSFAGGTSKNTST